MSDGAYPLPGPIALRGNLLAALGEAEQGPAAVRSYRRAWVLAALGRYGEALAAADRADTTEDLAAAAAHALRASVLRQVRLYERAAVEDREGEERLSAVARSDWPADVVADVAANLAIGRVADAVGHTQIQACGDSGEALDSRLAEARERVAQLRAHARERGAGGAPHGTGWRQPLRLEWVTGETALTRGEVHGALRAFAAARRLSSARGARRHEAKSTLFLAGARAANGDLALAARLAASALATARACGAQPLTWPARLILSEAAAAHGSRGAALIQRDRANATRLALISGLPPPLRQEAEARLEVVIV